LKKVKKHKALGLLGLVAEMIQATWVFELATRSMKCTVKDVRMS